MYICTVKQLKQNNMKTKTQLQEMIKSVESAGNRVWEKFKETKFQSYYNRMKVLEAETEALKWVLENIKTKAQLQEKINEIENTSNKMWKRYEKTKSQAYLNSVEQLGAEIEILEWCLNIEEK
jgi:archaellum component FlaC